MSTYKDRALFSDSRYLELTRDRNAKGEGKWWKLCPGENSKTNLC